MAERAVILIGEDPIRNMLSEEKSPDVMIGVDLSWDKDAGAWRADWEGGTQFGETKHEAAMNGLRDRLVPRDGTDN